MFFIAVVIPISISGFIINNINQQSVRHQLRESAILVASMVSDEVDFFLKTNESTLAQIADTLEYLPSKKLKSKFIKDVARRYPNCEDIVIVHNPQELEKITDDSHINEKPILSTQMKDGSFLVIIFILCAVFSSICSSTPAYKSSKFCSFSGSFALIFSM